MNIDELRKHATLSIPVVGMKVLGYGSRSASYEAAAKGHIPGVRQMGGKKVVSVPVLLAWLLGDDVTRDDGTNVVPLRQTG